MRAGLPASLPGPKPACGGGGRGNLPSHSPLPAPWISILHMSHSTTFQYHHLILVACLLYIFLLGSSHHQLEEQNFCCLHFVQGQNERGNEKIICFIVRQTARLRRSIVPRQNLLNLVITEWMTDSYQIIHGQWGVNIARTWKELEK